MARFVYQLSADFPSAVLFSVSMTLKYVCIMSSCHCKYTMQILRMNLLTLNEDCNFKENIHRKGQVSTGRIRHWAVGYCFYFLHFEVNGHSVVCLPIQWFLRPRSRKAYI